MSSQAQTLRDRLRQAAENYEIFAEEAAKDPEAFDHSPAYYRRHAKQLREGLDE